MVSMSPIERWPHLRGNWIGFGCTPPFPFQLPSKPILTKFILAHVPMHPFFPLSHPIKKPYHYKNKLCHFQIFSTIFLTHIGHFGKSKGICIHTLYLLLYLCDQL